jgi:Fe-S-cluster containining protein
VIRLQVVQSPADDAAMHPNCTRCPALCCSYVSTEIDAPTTRRDFDILRWYLMHPGVRVYCEGGTDSWFLQFMTRCRNLGDNGLCRIYEERPQICRDLKATECEFALGPGDRWLFTNLEEFDRWMVERARQKQERAVARARQRRSGRGPRATLAATPRQRR